MRLSRKAIVLLSIAAAKAACFFLPVLSGFGDYGQGLHYFSGGDTNIWFVDLLLCTILLGVGLLTEKSRDAGTKIVLSLLTPAFAAAWIFAYSFDWLYITRPFVASPEPFFYLLLLSAVSSVVIAYYWTFRKRDGITQRVSLPMQEKILTTVTFGFVCASLALPAVSKSTYSKQPHIVFYGFEHVPFLVCFAFLTLFGAIGIAQHRLVYTRFLLIFFTVLLVLLVFLDLNLPQQPSPLIGTYVFSTSALAFTVHTYRLVFRKPAVPTLL